MKHAQQTPGQYGPVQLLILQASPFCNLDCKYCYLPDRSVTRKMPLEVIEASVDFVLDGGLVRDRLSIVWHAGEPLTVPIAFYESAADAIEKKACGRCVVTHAVQTNATTINQDWCDFIKRRRFQVGVSLDGPAFLNDVNRVTRSGEGTFDKTMRGIRLLQQNGIDFHVIAVLTKTSLQHADDIFAFFRGIGVTRLGFNIEEAEGQHTRPSITQDTEADYVRFIERFADLCKEATEPPAKLCVREFVNMESSIRAHANEWGPRRGQECTPFVIVTVDAEGNLSTFSPELMGNVGRSYSGFVFGNVLRDKFADVVMNPAFQAAWRDIQAGVEMCERSCQYFGVCGGGAPANKYYENGTFASTETVHCRHKIQLVAEHVLKGMEGVLASEGVRT